MYDIRSHYVYLLPSNQSKFMSTFLQKLKRNGLSPEATVSSDAADVAIAPAQAAAPAGVIQLPVDVYQSSARIVIYAQIPGCDLKSLEVSIEGENDVLIVQGDYKRPEDLVSGGAEMNGEFSFEECNWGSFYRQIILPQEIDAEKADAKVKDGVLVLSMPLKGVTEKKIRMNVVKVGDSS